MSVGSEVQRTGGESGPGDPSPAGDEDPDAGGPTRGALSDSEVFDILRNSRRRSVLTHLREEGELSVTSLTRHVAADEYDVAIDDLSPAQHKRVYTGLYQCHLPRLDEADVVTFDKDAKTVSITDGAAQVEQYLNRPDDATTARAEIGAAVIVAATVSLGTLGVWPAAPVPAAAWAMVTAVALFGFAMFQVYATRALP